MKKVDLLINDYLLKGSCDLLFAARRADKIDFLTLQPITRNGLVESIELENYSLGIYDHAKVISELLPKAKVEIFRKTIIITY